jgi:hypothetical protein
MISKQKLTNKLRRLEEEINRLRVEIEKSTDETPGVTLRGKYSHLEGFSYKDILEAKKIWPSARAK